MTAFEPLNGASFADQLMDWCRDKPVGTQLRYDDAELPFDLMSRRGVVTTVTKRMEREQQRTLRVIRGVGYEIVKGIDQVEEAAKRRRKAARGAKRALHAILHTDRREMSGADAARADAELIVNQGLAREAHYSSRRIAAADAVELAKQKSAT